MDWAFPVGVYTSVFSPGFFAFWARENLQANALISSTCTFTASIAEEFDLERFECSVFLIRS